MPANPLTITPNRKFEHLPAYARVLHDQYLNEYIDVSVRLSREANLPLLHYFRDLPEEQWKQLTKKTASEFLMAIAENKTEEFTKQSTEKWISNQLPEIELDQVVIEDITLAITFAKKCSPTSYRVTPPNQKISLHWYTKLMT